MKHSRSKLITIIFFKAHATMTYNYFDESIICNIMNFLPGIDIIKCRQTNTTFEMVYKENYSELVYHMSNDGFYRDRNRVYNIHNKEYDGPYVHDLAVLYSTCKEGPYVLEAMHYSNGDLYECDTTMIYYMRVTKDPRAAYIIKKGRYRNIMLYSDNKFIGTTYEDYPLYHEVPVHKDAVDAEKMVTFDKIKIGAMSHLTMLPNVGMNLHRVTNYKFILSFEGNMPMKLRQINKILNCQHGYNIHEKVDKCTGDKTYKFRLNLYRGIARSLGGLEVLINKRVVGIVDGKFVPIIDEVTPRPQKINSQQRE